MLVVGPGVVRSRCAGRQRAGAPACGDTMVHEECARFRMHRLDPDLPAPAYSHEGDAGADLFARTGTTIPPEEGVLLCRRV